MLPKPAVVGDILAAAKKIFEKNEYQNNRALLCIGNAQRGMVCLRMKFKYSKQGRRDKMLKRPLQKLTAKKWIYVAILLLVTVFRVLLSRSMQIYFSSGTIYDDLMQTGKAMAIANGEWLGGYGSTTLVKGIGYPLFTALFHWMGIPFISAYHGIYILACLFFMLAMRPLIQNKWVGAAGYVFLLFNPIAFSSQLTRLYRDIGYYSVSFFCVAATIGFLLRYKSKNGGIWFALASGAGLAVAHNFREDSHWLYVYVLACLLVWLILRVGQVKRGANKKALYRIPAVILAGWFVIMLPVSAMNKAYYGTWEIDEYNSGPYAKAFGALKRIDGGLENPHIVIPYEKRMELYKLSPAFAELYGALDAPGAPFEVWKEMQGEYRTGYFSFVLRDAVASLGYYKDAQTAAAYYNRLADEVNAVCDARLIEAATKSYGITARYYPWMTWPIVQATFEGMAQTLAGTGISPIPIPAQEDDVYLQHYEGFVHDTIAADRYMEDETIQGNYHFSGLQLWGQRFIRVCVMGYQILLPLLFVCALAGYLLVLVVCLVRKCGRPGFAADSLAVFSLLCLFLLRSAMIAFVHVSSFSAMGNPAYQAASYPVLLGFIVISVLYIIQWQPFAKMRPVGNTGRCEKEK